MKRQSLFAFSVLCSVLALSGAVLKAQEPPSPRTVLSLNSDWAFQRDGEAHWKTVQLPASFQSHEGTDFHGIGWYRKQLAPFSFPAHKRVLLQFQAAATETEVWCDGHLLGTHLGGWTPFRFDITELLRRAGPQQGHELRVRVDEKVGHNTQGFLPAIEPHFGGLWQGVSLCIVPETYLDELRIMAIGDPDKGELLLEVPIAGTSADFIQKLELRARLRGTLPWKALSASTRRDQAALIIRAPLADFRRWSPAAPNLYEVEISLPGPRADRVQVRAAFRSIRINGPEFLLNDQPLSIRGVLNWGYSAPHLAPNPGEATWRSELEFARSHGFNLMKFCLWVPPPRYLELADEMGMLTWMEYPTWHPTLTAKFLQPLRKEFDEFFDYDRNHPSVILRSLTCETGSSAEIGVIRSLYDAAHRAIPGALVEDDSSWIGWNRIHDFYDDHPYGNNHTWVKTLAGFNDFVRAHGVKPLVLGETTAADTWIDRASILTELGPQRPWWAPHVLDDTARWLEEMRLTNGAGGLDQLRSDSLRYGLLMRKFQIEAFRREVPYGGYVISVIRDFPGASMGLLDYLGRPKWSAEDWGWQRETICLLQTEADRRSFTSGESLKARLLLSHFGLQPLTNAVLELSLAAQERLGEPLQRVQRELVEQNPGTLAEVSQLNWPLPEVTAPTHLVLRAALRTGQSEFHNEWPLWVVPPSSTGALRGIEVHGSVDASLRNELFPGCPMFNASESAKSAETLLESTNQRVVVASRFDRGLVEWLEHGGRVLFLPDGQENSLPLSPHWFLKGAPYIPNTRFTQPIPRELLLELQHFDLAGDVLTNFPCLGSIDPIVMLWDTHDDKVVKTHALAFETRAANGRLLVSALRHAGPGNSAGRWLLGVFVEQLRRDPPPDHGLSDDTWANLKAKLNGEKSKAESAVSLLK